jgi:hypothetical protein
MTQDIRTKPWKRMDCQVRCDCGRPAKHQVRVHQVISGFWTQDQSLDQWMALCPSCYWEFELIERRDLMYMSMQDIQDKVTLEILEDTMVPALESKFCQKGDLYLIQRDAAAYAIKTDRGAGRLRVLPYAIARFLVKNGRGAMTEVKKIRTNAPELDKFLYHSGYIFQGLQPASDSALEEEEQPLVSA